VKYCPSCKYEYEDNIKKCSDCGTTLVSAEEFENVKDQPTESEMTGETIRMGGFEWQRLTELETEQQAEQVREIMKQFTIPIEVRKADKEILIYVPKVQYQTALSVIHKVFAMSAQANGSAEVLAEEFDVMENSVEDDVESENDGFGAKILMVLGVVAVAAMIYSFMS